jgi:hypothetical protein
MGAARAVCLLDAPVSHPSPRIGDCTPVCTEAVKSAGGIRQVLPRVLPNGGVMRLE